MTSIEVGLTKLIFRYMGLPAWLFSKSKIKISQLGKRPFDFLKIAPDLLSHFAILVLNKINMISAF